MVSLFLSCFQTILIFQNLMKPFKIDSNELKTGKLNILLGAVPNSLIFPWESDTRKVLIKDFVKKFLGHQKIIVILIIVQWKIAQTFFLSQLPSTVISKWFELNISKKSTYVNIFELI